MNEICNSNIFIDNLIDLKLEKINNEFLNLKNELSKLLKMNKHKIIAQKKMIDDKIYFIGNDDKIYDLKAKIVGNVKDNNYIFF